MKNIITSILLLLVLSVPVFAQLTRDQLPPEMSRQISDEQLELTNWMMYYYKKPVPNQFPNWLKRASAAGMLKEPKRQFPFLGFEATIFAMNEDKISLWMKTIDALPEEDRKNVLMALWLSGTKSSQEVLLDKSRQRLIRGQNYFNFQTDATPLMLDDIANTYGGYLDIQWGRFSASGDDKPVRNIISVLEFAQFIGSGKKFPRPSTDEEKQAVLKEIYFQSAVWSLRSNCKIHSRVLDLCEKIYDEGNIGHLSQLVLRSILNKFKPEKYKGSKTSNKSLKPIAAPWAAPA